MFSSRHFRPPRAKKSPTVSQSLEETQRKCKEAEQKLKEATRSVEKAGNRREEIDKSVEEINMELRDTKDNQRKGRDEVKLIATIETLKRHYPGVHGRLFDLCRPTQRQFNMAVSVAVGKNMDAIVVDTKKTGLDCIRYMREHRVGMATFLPLDGLRVPSRESSERIRARVQQDGRFRLAADVISCQDESMKNAVLFAVENTVICDDLDAAREICFQFQNRGGDDARIKGVTLGGAVISKAGSMTGGVTSEDNNRAGRWDDQQLNEKLKQLRDRKEELEAEKAEIERGIGSTRLTLGSSGKIEELRNNYATLKSKADYSRSDAEFTRQQLVQKRILLESLQLKLPQAQQQLTKAEEDVRSLDAASKEAVANVKAAEDSHLGPFRDATGLKDLKAYEEANGQGREEFSKKRRVMVEHINHLEQQKAYQTNRDLKQPIVRLENRLKEQKEKLKAAEELEEQLQAEVEEAKTKLEEAAAEVEEASTVEKQREDASREAQKDFTETQAERARVSKAVNAEEAALEKLRGQLHETLQKARVEEVELPLIAEGSAEARGAEEGEDGTSESQRTATQDSRGQESRGMTQFSQDDNPKVVSDRHEVSMVNFSEMHPELRQRLSDREEWKVKKDFDDQLAKIDTQIQSMAPNMKVSFVLHF
jgi:structural maintenance of chromosome 1